MIMAFLLLARGELQAILMSARFLCANELLILWVSPETMMLTQPQYIVVRRMRQRVEKKKSATFIETS